MKEIKIRQKRTPSLNDTGCSDPLLQPVMQLEREGFYKSKSPAASGW